MLTILPARNDLMRSVSSAACNSAIRASLLIAVMGSPMKAESKPDALGVDPLRIDQSLATGRNDTATAGWREWQVPDGQQAMREFGETRVTLETVGPRRIGGGIVTDHVGRQGRSNRGLGSLNGNL